MKANMLVLSALCATAITVLGSRGLAYGPSDDDARLALPTAEDLTGFGRFHRVDNSSYHSFELAGVRDADGMNIAVVVSVKPTASEAQAWPGRYNAGVQLAGAGLRRLSSAGWQAGQHAWSSRREGQSTTRLVAIEGRCLAMVTVIPGSRRDENGRVVHDRLTEADHAFAVKQAKDVLERLAALGLVDRGKRKAASWARKQIRERLQEAREKPKRP